MPEQLLSIVIPRTNGGRRRISESDLADYLHRSKQLAPKQKPVPVRVVVKDKPRASYATLERFGLRV